MNSRAIFCTSFEFCVCIFKPTNMTFSGGHVINLETVVHRVAYSVVDLITLFSWQLHYNVLSINYISFMLDKKSGHAIIIRQRPRYRFVF